MRLGNKEVYCFKELFESFSLMFVTLRMIPYVSDGVLSSCKDWQEHATLPNPF